MTQTPMAYEQLKQSHDEWRMLAMHNYGVAKAAEAREQRLILAAQKVVDHTEPITYLSAMLSTLYPDTPAPKEGESDASLD
ncbi:MULTISPECIES: hypothetical protein [Paenibacillus]|uniref:Uncharacterized protein n=1 Tax=Paenibacillus odorifer TaxID=189426 RepID=A0ABX3HV93_9BACL|nr:hypothetical protein [Paenibacillus odorifer]OMD55274.1 hypothetical protein BSK51_04265 [Paenibacillus odorifer]